MKRIFVAIAVLVGLTLGAWKASAQAEITVKEAVQAVGLSNDDIAKVKSGEVVARDMSETTASMLAQGIIALVKAPPGELAEAAIAADTYKRDPSVIAYGKIDPNNIEASFAEAVFTEKEADEVKRLRDASPGSDFNLSSDEFKALKAAVEGGAESVEALSKVYRRFLVDRAKAYISGGLGAIAPYDRGGDTVSPAADLKAALEAATALKKVAPELYDAFLNYPKDKPEGVEETFLWLKATVEDRPTFALEHRMVYPGENMVVYLARQYFVGQSYDDLQEIAGAFPTDAGTAVLYGNRTMTDQVAGFMQGTRHSVGRGMMRDELVAKFEALRKKYK
jgi:hypothetical protein